MVSRKRLVSNKPTGPIVDRFTPEAHLLVWKAQSEKGSVLWKAVCDELSRRYNERNGDG